MDELTRVDDPPAPDEVKTVVPPDGIPAPPVLLLAVVPPLAREPALEVAPPPGREELLREDVSETPPEGIAEAPPLRIAEAPPLRIAEAPPLPSAPVVPPEGVAESLSSKSPPVMSERIPHPASSKAMTDVTRTEKVRLSMGGVCPFVV